MSHLFYYTRRAYPTLIVCPFALFLPQNLRVPLCIKKKKAYYKPLKKLSLAVLVFYFSHHIFNSFHASIGMVSTKTTLILAWLIFVGSFQFSHNINSMRLTDSDWEGFEFICGCRTVFYGQYKCTGPGASFAGRVSWSRELTDEEAKPFLSLTFIDGSEWITL